jgi:hypothetical protein
LNRFVHGNVGGSVIAGCERLFHALDTRWPFFLPAAMNLLGEDQEIQEGLACRKGDASPSCERTVTLMATKKVHNLKNDWREHDGCPEEEAGTSRGLDRDAR